MNNLHKHVQEFFYIFKFSIDESIKSLIYMAFQSNLLDAMSSSLFLEIILAKRFFTHGK